MRIAVNARFLLPGRLEGLGWYSHEVLSRMVKVHPEDEFVFIFDRPFNAQFIYAENVRPLVVYPPARHPLLWWWWFEQSLPRLLEREKPDVLFSPDSYLSLKSKVRTLMTVHDVLPLEHPEQIPWAPRTYYQHFLPRYIQRADRISTVSQFTKDRLLELAPTVPESRVGVAYNGCRSGFVPLSPMEQTLVRNRFSDGKPFFLYSGSIHPRKNVHRLIAAFDRFKTDTGADVKLLLAGRKAWETADVDAAWQAARHKSDILFLGYVAEQELPKLLASALALTYLSTGEGFGLPLVEAMYTETAVLCSNVSALPEVAGNAALMCSPYNVEEIADNLKKIYSDVNFRLALIQKGRERRGLFNWDQTATTLYQDLAGL